MPRTAYFQVSEQAIDSSTRIITVAGELDLSTTPEIEERIDAALEEGIDKLVIDMCAVTYLDSTSLRALISAQRRLEQSGGRLALACDQPLVLKLFRITLLDQRFDILPRPDAALAHLDVA